MYRKSRWLINRTESVPRIALSPFRCCQCNKYFHEFWFSTTHKKKHKELYKKFWLNNCPFVERKPRLDALCEKMMAQQIQRGDEAASSSDRKHYNTRSASKTNQNCKTLDASSSNVTLDASSSNITLDATSSKITLDASSSNVKLDASSSNVKLDTSSSNVKLDASNINTSVSSIHSDIPKESHPTVVHQKYPSDGMNFLCQQCNRGFSKRKDLFIHKQEHGKDHPVRCPLCSESFMNETQLGHHHQQSHDKGLIDNSYQERGECLKAHECAETDRYSKEGDVCDKTLKDASAEPVSASSRDKLQSPYCKDSSASSMKEQGTSGAKDHKAGTSSEDEDKCCCTLKQLLEQAIDKQLPLCRACDADQIPLNAHRAVPVEKMDSSSEESCEDIHLPQYEDSEVGRERDQVVGGKNKRKVSRHTCDAGKSLVSGDIDVPVLDANDGEAVAQDLKYSEGYVNPVSKSNTEYTHKRNKSKLLAGHSRLDGEIPGNRSPGRSQLESTFNNNNKDDYPVGDEDAEDPMDLAISRQPLVKSLTMGKAPATSKRKVSKKVSHEGQKFAAMDGGSDRHDTFPEESSGQEQEGSSSDKVGTCMKKQKLIHTIADKLTEAIIHDLDAPDDSDIEMRPLDLSIAKPDVIGQRFADRSNMDSSDVRPRRPAESLKIQIPTSFQGPGDSAIEKELLRFYGQAITYIGLTVYREHEKELYGHDLSQVGLFNTGQASDAVSHKRPR